MAPQQQTAPIQAEPHFTMAQVLEMMKEFAQEIKKPYVDPLKAERDRRDQAKSRQDYRQGQAFERAKQEACRHKFKNGTSAISLMHNFADGQRRGVCNRCKLLIQPAHIEILYDPTNPNGKAIMVPAHRLFPMLEEIAARNAEV